MRTLRIAAPALALVLLLSTTVGLVAHDHAVAVPKDGYECVSDHRSDSHPASSSAAALLAGDQRHRHHCFGCRLAGHRSLTLSKIEAANEPDLRPTRASLPSSPPRPQNLQISLFLRGPPAC